MLSPQEAMNQVDLRRLQSNVVTHNYIHSSVTDRLLEPFGCIALIASQSRREGCRKVVKMVG